MTVWDFIETQDPLTLVLAVIMFIGLVGLGVVKIPWINWPKKKVKKHSDCVEIV